MSGTPALATLGPGTDVAQKTVDAAILRDPVRDGAGRIRASRARMANIRQNIALAHRLRGVFLATPVFGITALWPAILAETGATARLA
ncbi:hypothetical protein [Salipiger marinus]|uniref:hypothetical protein n=1 Tax=Salipiger marinus TaxID=555512 RepID=UPI004058C743